jgi:phosphoglycolate phosphatase
VFLGRYENVVWDWNGTLLDDVDHAVDVMNEILAAHGLEALTVERYRHLFEFPVRKYYDRLGFDTSDATFEVVARRFIDSYVLGVKQCRIRPEAPVLLAALAERGVSCSILSASEESALEDQVAHFGLKDFFTHRCGLNDHYARSKAGVGRAWLEMTGAKPERTVLIGDTVHDHEVALELGFDCILVRGGHSTCAKLDATGTTVVDSLAALVE